MIAKSFDGDPVVERESGRIVPTIDGVRHELPSADATAHVTDLGETLAGRREFVHTVGECRPDGSYIVSRRGTDSAGHRKFSMR